MYTALTTRQLLERNASSSPDKTFLVCDDVEWSNAETLRRASQVASGLRGLGVQEQDRVSSWLPNSPEGLLSLFGVNLAGAVQAPLNLAYRGALLEHALNLVESRVLIAHHELLDRLDGLALPHLETVIVVGDEPAGSNRWPVIPWNDVSTSDVAALPDVEPWDDMVVIYTSGTTGPSKGVRCSYQHHHAYADWLHVGDLGADDRGLISLPMFHVGGTAWVYALMCWGGSIALLPRFDTKAFWADVRRLGATTGVVMGAMATFLLEQEPQEDDAENPLRIALATPAIPGWEAFSKRFGVELWAGFAMTEVPGPLRSSFPTFELAGAGRPTSPDWAVRLVDDNDIEVPQGTPGELMVRHETPWTVTHGYVGMPEATADAWRNGWFHTGDVMVERSDGTFVFVDRKKDALRRRGENISSFDVEKELLAHPDVVDAAVVSTRSTAAEDEVLAFVVLKEGSTLEHRAFAAFLVPRLPHFMVPRYVEFVAELPRTPTGKVRKVELRERGVGQGTWDREAAGMVLKSTRLSTRTPPAGEAVPK